MPNRLKPVGRPSDEQARDSARAVGFFSLIAIGAVATTGVTIIAMFYALSGRDARALGLLAMFIGVAMSLAVAIAPLFAKQQPTASAVSAPASSRRTAFVSLSSMWLALYVLAIANMHWLLGIAAWPFWAGVAAAFGATMSVGGLVYALLRYLMRETDEYQRLLLMRAALIAAALTFFTLTAWGLLELYVGAPHLPVALVLAPFCLFFAIANWWVRGRT
jgi:hypothetical protein